MRLAIADPPYPPFVGSGGRKNRASRWYGDGQRSRKDARMVADFHPEAHRWDDPAEHRALLEFLLDEFDGWAIATSPDGVAAYDPLPAACRLMAWVKPNATPGAHRIRSLWEAVIVYPPEGRRSNRGGVGGDTGRAHLSGASPRVHGGEARRVDVVGARRVDLSAHRRGRGPVRWVGGRGRRHRQLPSVTHPPQETCYT
jgi:hypothetical protein